MKTIQEQIKKQEFKQIYLLCGTERYLILNMREGLRKAIVVSGDTLNETLFEGNKIDLLQVKEIANTMPFFSERRLIVIEESGLFKKSSDAMIDILKIAPESTFFIFVENEVDKRNKLYKYVKKNGYVAELNGLTEKELFTFVARILARAGKKIRESTVNYFIAVAGTDMNLLKNETEKLISYVGEREEVTKKDIDAIVTPEITNKIFDMLTHIVYKRQRQALDLYYDLLAQREKPLRILSLLTRQFQILVQVKDLMGQRKSRQEMAKAVGLAPFIVGKYEAQARGFSMGKLKEYMKECVKIEEAIKTGQMVDSIGIELLIVRFSEEE